MTLFEARLRRMTPAQLLAQAECSKRNALAYPVPSCVMETIRQVCNDRGLGKALEEMENRIREAKKL